jgi:thioredoxin-related protein
MKKLFLMMAVCWLAAQANAAEWLTDLSKAQAQAKAEHKLVFMDFTGSDWCPPCIELHKKVLTSREFEDYAQKNLVLVVVDFPEKIDQPKDLAKANDAMKEKFKIEGFPTLLVLDENGKELDRQLGFFKPAKELIAHLDSIKPKSP